jgi:hypothetical protein
LVPTNKSQPVVVTIIDRLQSRREALEKVFSDLSIVQEAWRKSGSDKVEGNVSSKVESLIVFRHMRDKKILPGNGNNDNTVYYGGKGGEDSDFPKDGKERIWRIVDEDTGHLSTDEAAQLLDYFKLPVEERNDDNRPDILKKIFVPLITSLSILSQGYLMAGVAAGKIVDKKVEELIGWNDKIKEIFPKSESDWEEGWEKVKKPKWWWDVFAEDKETALKSMKEKIDLEWKNRPDVFNTLFDMIKGERVDKPSVVTQVYCAISKKLRGRL